MKRKRDPFVFLWALGAWGAHLFIWERGPNCQFIEGGTMN